MSRPTLGGVELIQTAFSGFHYPQRAQLVTILDDGSGAAGNAAIQSSGLGYRQATLACAALGPTDKDSLEAFYEDLSEQTFTDHDGIDHQVMVIAFSAEFSPGDRWDMTMTLVELSAGS